MLSIKAPYSIEEGKDDFAIFLAGSVEEDAGGNWRAEIAKELAGSGGCLLDPLRTDWDASWKTEVSDPQFNEQTTWELDALERADLIIFYFAAGTKAAVSMLELGLFAKSGKVLVCCPDGFWKKGNIDIVCKRYNVKQVNTLKEIIQYIKTSIL
jgi:hypothetical protein